MSKALVYLLMIFLHILEDFHLQGILANMKSIRWWADQIDNEFKNEDLPAKLKRCDLYKYDYIVALIMHSFSWSFMIMIPIIIYYNFTITIPFLITIIINMIIHGIVDNLKANKYKINLIIDQSIHIVQIFVTFLILVILI